jgi:hypothetical protein
MAPAPTGNPRLRVLRAVEDGWTAFSRAPWPFVLFTLLYVALSIPFQLISDPEKPPVALLPPGQQLVLVGVGLLGSLLVNLWGTAGLIRGAWIAAEGGSPRFADFRRWDGGASLRLLLHWLLLAGAALLFALVCLLPPAALAALAVRAWGGIGAVPEAVVVAGSVAIVILLLLALTALAYAAFSQSFLNWLALLGERKLRANFLEGARIVTLNLWQVGLLGLIQAGILTLGFLLCCVGLVAAWPLGICISTTAYRQLFGNQARADFVGPAPSPDPVSG